MAFRNFEAYGSNMHDRYIQHNEESTAHKLKNAYWTTKQAVMKKLGKKEDEHVVASDSALDAKLELYKSVQTTSNDLSRFTNKYMDCICALSQAENEMGRFLKQCSQSDFTKAGEMMAMTGKTLSYSAQKRIALRTPLERLGQEMDTFRLRAIGDCLKTLQKMENRRTEYRGALMWMKNASEELEPDSFKQMEKFRKVQAQVKKAKEGFDRLKIDSMQKIDLLAASRSNLLSHVLVAYQSALLEFWEKTATSMTAIAENFQGYQYYEFSTLKELNVDNKRLALTSAASYEQAQDAMQEGSSRKDVNLLDLDEAAGPVGPDLFSQMEPMSGNDVWLNDLVSNQEVSKDDKEFLLDIFGADSSVSGQMMGQADGWLQEDSTRPFSAAWSCLSQSTFRTEAPPEEAQKDQMKQNPSKDSAQPNSTSAWMDLFSDLGPLGNPDSIGHKANEIENL